MAFATGATGPTCTARSGWRGEERRVRTSRGSLHWTGAISGALLLEQNDEYAIQTRYMGVESVAQLSKNAINRLQAARALA